MSNIQLLGIILNTIGTITLVASIFIAKHRNDFGKKFPVWAIVMVCGEVIAWSGVLLSLLSLTN